MTMDAEEIIRRLELKPLPREGGFFRETYRARESLAAGALPARYPSERSLSTCILYLLTSQSASAFHRLPAEEIFHFYLGDPVEMLQLRPDGTSVVFVLGHEIDQGEHVQLVVPGGVWQGSRLRPGGKYALMGTTMAPGFDFADYEEADVDRLVRDHPDHVDMIRDIMRHQPSSGM